MSPQRVITEMKTKHILCLLPIQAAKNSPGANITFKLAIGYYAKYIQLFEMMDSSDGNGYVFVDQRQSDVNYHEKPGISCLHSASLKSSQNKSVII